MPIWLKTRIFYASLFVSILILFIFILLFRFMAKTLICSDRHRS